jgi:hypothetical protein
MERGFGFLAHGGRYVLVSVVRENVTFSDPEFHKCEGTLLASRNAQPDDFAEVVRQMQPAPSTHTTVYLPRLLSCSPCGWIQVPE